MANFYGIYLKGNSHLIESTFKMPFFEGNQAFNSNMFDVISNIQIADKIIEFVVERRVEFLPGIPHVIVKFKTSLETQNPITKEQFIADIRNNLPLLNSAFARISLVIANISSATAFGPIVLIPAYDPKQINII